MKKKEINLGRLIKPIIFLALALALELIQFAIFGFKSIDGTTQLLPSYILLDIAIWLIFAGVIFAMNKKWSQDLCFYIFLLIQIVFNIINIILCKTLGNVFYFKLIGLASEGTEAFDWGMVRWGFIISNIAVLIVAIISQIVIDKFANINLQLKKISVRTLGLLVFAVCLTIGVTTFGVQINYLSPYDQQICDELTLKNYSMQKLGTFGFYIRDAINSISKPKPDLTKEEALQLIENGQKQENTQSILHNDNLIIIMLESFDEFAIDPYNTPTIYNLMKDSIVANQFISNNKTNISETIGLLGYMPFEEELSLEDNQRLATKYSLPNLFKNQGYQTNYFHSYKSSFYNRDEIIAKLGFDNTFFLEDAEFPDKSMNFYEWNSEVDFFNYFKEQIAPTNGSKFMSYYLTVATHGKYTTPNIRFQKYYDQYDHNLENTDFKNWFTSQGFIFPEDKETQTYLKHFKAAAMDTDAMVKSLLEHLNTPLENGKKLLDNTSILFYADHNSYYHDLCYTIKNTDAADTSNLKSYQVPMFIYSQKLGHQEIDNFTNTYDLHPTICELYGLPYSTYMTYGNAILNNQGQDISNNEDKVYFSQKVGYYSSKFHSTGINNPMPVAGGGIQDISDATRYINNVKIYYEKQKNLHYIYTYKW